MHLLDHGTSRCIKLRKLHSLLGLVVALLAVVLALSGAVLSLDPALERRSNSLPADGQISVAALAGRVAQHYPGVEQIQRTPSGSVIVYYNRDGQTGVDRVDPQTGQGIAPHAVSPFFRWMKSLHRSWLLDTPGRVVSGLVAAGGLAAALSTADGLLLTIANALSHDVYYKMLDPNASTARRVTISPIGELRDPGFQG